MSKVTDEQELADVLRDTPGGLEKLHCFLDAVEKLAVTSLHVFTVENPVLSLPEGIRPEHVRGVIFAALMICPLLLKFKRDTSVFVRPKLQNVEVLIYQLNEYIQTTQIICEMLEKSSLSDFLLGINGETLVDLDVDLSEVQSMLCHINDLKEIRDYQPFRLVFLFQEVSCSDFIREVRERRPRMLQSLEDLNQCAVQLDGMNLGAKISSVLGSSVDAVGSVLSMAGLLLIPGTAVHSRVLIITGMGMGIASAVTSLVTTATEIGENRKQQKKASEVFQSLMEDVQSIQDCLRVVSFQPAINSQLKAEYDKLFSHVGSVFCKAGALGKDIDSLVDAASAIKVLKSEALAVSAGKVAVQEGKALRNVSRVARAGLIGLNALFLGMDVFFICKDSISLAKVSQFIRARATLWCSEMDSWQKIYDFMCKGLLTSEENKADLETPFHPDKEMKKRRETGMKIPFDEVDEKEEIDEKQSCVIQ
ncbi:uncharacterized protein LOC142943574 [Anarhichas minor]|uniref:uncharacterized protein LOC142943574 n=1 Tax=Anarhichas minor TaxID=65739 RepID=UPI003F73714D